MNGIIASHHGAAEVSGCLAPRIFPELGRFLLPSDLEEASDAFIFSPSWLSLPASVTSFCPCPKCNSLLMIKNIDYNEETVEALPLELPTKL